MREVRMILHIEVKKHKAEEPEQLSLDKLDKEVIRSKRVEARQS